MSIATASNIKRLLALTGLTHEELGEIAGIILACAVTCHNMP